MSTTELTKDQQEILLHSLGKSHTPKKKDMGWRHYYNVAEGCTDYDTCQSLVALGHMTQKGEYFFVTDQGAASVGVKIKR